MWLSRTLPLPPTLLFLILLLTLWPFPLDNTSPVIFSSAQSPMETLTDEYGNFADDASNVLFVDFNETAKYETPTGRAVTDRVFMPFRDLARAIARSSFGPGYPYDLVVEIAQNPTDVAAIQSRVSPRFVVCLAVAGLLVLVFLVMALCLPCCLCCSPCCHRRKTLRPRPAGASSSAPSILRVGTVGVVILVLVGVFAIWGLAGTYTMLVYSRPAREEAKDNLLSAMRDLRTYLLFSTNEILFIFAKANFTQRVFYRDLDNIGSLMGQGVYDALANRSGLTEAVDDLLDIEATAKRALTTLQSMDAKMDQLGGNLTALNDVLTEATANCGVCAEPPTLQFNKPDYSEAEDSLSALNNINLSAIINRGLSQIRSIPEITKEQAKPQITELKENLQTQLNTLDEFKHVVRDMCNQTLSAVKIEDVKKPLNERYSTVAEYDDIRLKVQKVLLTVPLVGMVLVVVGVGVVLWVYRRRREDVARGREPKACFNTVCGGRVMCAGIALFLVLGWLWLLFAVVFFIVGAPLDALLCAAVQDPDYAIVDELIEKRNIFGEHPNGSMLAQYVLPVPNSTATVGSILRDCRDDKTLFTAVQLDKHPAFNFSAAIQFYDQLNISSLISAIDVPVNETRLVSPELVDYLNKLTAVENRIPFSDLARINSTIDAQKLQVKDYVSSLPSQVRTGVQPEVDQHVQSIGQLQVDIQNDVDWLEENLRDIGDTTNSTRQKADRAERRIPALTDGALREGARDYEDRLSSIIRSFIQECEKNVFEDYGKCGALHNIMESLLHKGVCGNLANLLNGGWLSIYWLHSFMLVAILLSIHFHLLIPLPPPPPFTLPPPRPHDPGLSNEPPGEFPPAGEEIPREFPEESSEESDGSQQISDVIPELPERQEFVRDRSFAGPGRRLSSGGDDDVVYHPYYRHLVPKSSFTNQAQLVGSPTTDIQPGTEGRHPPSPVHADKRTDTVQRLSAKRPPAESSFSQDFEDNERKEQVPGKVYLSSGSSSSDDAASAMKRVQSSDVDSGQWLYVDDADDADDHNGNGDNDDGDNDDGGNDDGGNDDNGDDDGENDSQIW